ncbi:DUF2721 domain-containing protein [Sphingobium sp. SCG-1]|uniref:DUF2721 domain-containing protein n=1 Tax=Sphingobium sp. SCG-1 TaxID=2072936 RepID=UPI00166FE55D|nr:DUF2721 domain-containing protein [Sphingobium sp. SCG-1]
MGFLQQRYDNASDRYRATVGNFRSGDHSGERADNLKDQVLVYRRRCKMMGWATTVGLVAAILLILALIFGALEVIVPKVPVIAYAGIASTIGGFALVIAAAVIVIIEGRVVHRQIDAELRDVPEFADELGEEAGSVRQQGPLRA